MRVIDQVGQRFGMLVVVAARSGIDGGQRIWTVRCDCGVQKDVLAGNVRANRTVSCGCYRRISNVAAKTRHGHSGANVSPEYRAWMHMRNRCSNPADASYSLYGDRGIRVCDRWSVFENFFSDMGARPSASHSLDRIDNERGYEPDNCRWATPKVQCRNRRCVKMDEVTASQALWMVVDGGYRIADVGRAFSVSASTVSLIVHGKTWVES